MPQSRNMQNIISARQGQCRMPNQQTISSSLLSTSGEQKHPSQCGCHGYGHQKSLRKHRFRGRKRPRQRFNFLQRHRLPADQIAQRHAVRRRTKPARIGWSNRDHDRISCHVFYVSELGRYTYETTYGPFLATVHIARDDSVRRMAPRTALRSDTKKTTVDVLWMSDGNELDESGR